MVLTAGKDVGERQGALSHLGSLPFPIRAGWLGLFSKAAGTFKLDPMVSVSGGFRIWGWDVSFLRLVWSLHHFLAISNI